MAAPLPTTERTPQGDQFVLPGAERRAPVAPGRSKSGRAQASPDGLPLFRDGVQRDLI